MRFERSVSASSINLGIYCVWWCHKCVKIIWMAIRFQMKLRSNIMAKLQNAIFQKDIFKESKRTDKKTTCRKKAKDRFVGVVVKLKLDAEAYIHNERWLQPEATIMQNWALQFCLTNFRQNFGEQRKLTGAYASAPCRHWTTCGNHSENPSIAKKEIYLSTPIARAKGPSGPKDSLCNTWVYFMFEGFQSGASRSQSENFQWALEQELESLFRNRNKKSDFPFDHFWHRHNHCDTDTTIVTHTQPL